MLICESFTREEAKALTTVSIAKKNAPCQIADGIVESCPK